MTAEMSIQIDDGEWEGGVKVPCKEKGVGFLLWKMGWERNRWAGRWPLSYPGNKDESDFLVWGRLLKGGCPMGRLKSLVIWSPICCSFIYVFVSVYLCVCVCVRDREWKWDLWAHYPAFPVTLNLIRSPNQMIFTKSQRSGHACVCLGVSL